jgi:hypothetical protein
MKRFLLFRGEQYYPRGGWHDFVDSFNTLEEARRATFNVESWGWDFDTDWAMVVDSEFCTIVWRFDAGKTRELPQE